MVERTVLGTKYIISTTGQENIGGLIALSSGYRVMLPVNIFKTKFPSLLIRFIITADGKYNTS